MIDMTEEMTTIIDATAVTWTAVTTAVTTAVKTVE
jgi:hypothetical protein